MAVELGLSSGQLRLNRSAGPAPASRMQRHGGRLRRAHRCVTSRRAVPLSGPPGREPPWTIAFIFPGQGAQTIGMGRDLAEAYPAARAVYDEVDAALGERLSALIWEGEQDALTLTRNAQPALMATSMAAMAALKAEGVEVTAAACVAGHSLGEYSALAAAGALSLGDAARLFAVARRGDAGRGARRRRRHGGAAGPRFRGRFSHRRRGGSRRRLRRGQ